MDLETYDKATELLRKTRLCETLLEYMSDPDAVKGYKYRMKCAEFFTVFRDEMLVFTHNLMTKCGEEFYDLSSCNCSDSATEEPESPPADAKFQIGDRVEVVKSLSSIMIGSVGTIESYSSSTQNYGVRLDRFPADALLQWYAEDELEPYVETETPEEKGGGDTDPSEGE